MNDLLWLDRTARAAQDDHDAHLDAYDEYLTHREEDDGQWRHEEARRKREEYFAMGGI